MSKDAIRSAMPTVAAIVDELRPFLGRVIYAAENGHVIDRRTPEGEAFTVPPNYYPCREVKKERK